MRDVEVVVHLSEVCDKRAHLLGIAGALVADAHVVGNDAVAPARRQVLCIEGDDLGQVHGVCRAVDDVCAIVGERSARLVRHRVDDAQQRVGERHARKALRVMHRVARRHVAVVGGDEVFLDHLDRVDGERIGIVAVCRGNIRLDGVRHRVHTRVRDELLGHRLGKFGIDDGDIGRDLEVSDGIFDALCVVGDDGERGDFGGSAARGGDGAELRLMAQLRDAEHLAHFLERDVGILILDPHRFCGVDGRAAAHCDDPVGLELEHCLRALSCQSSP